MKNRPKLTKEESKIFEKAVKFCNKDPILRSQSSAIRRSWCEGFMNGHLYYKHNQHKRRWYEFWR